MITGQLVLERLGKRPSPPAVRPGAASRRRAAGDPAIGEPDGRQRSELGARPLGSPSRNAASARAS